MACASSERKVRCLDGLTELWALIRDGGTANLDPRAGAREVFAERALEHRTGPQQERVRRRFTLWSDWYGMERGVPSSVLGAWPLPGISWAYFSSVPAAEGCWLP